MLQKIKDNKVLLFLLKALGLYILWYLLYELWLDPLDTLDKPVINNLVFVSGWLLKSIGFHLIEEPHIDIIRTIGIDGTNGIWIGDPCNGVVLFALFTGFVMAYPGSVKKKLWFIPLGLVTIHLLNIFRIIGLCMIVLYAPEFLEINHTYTFTILVYSYVFFLWMLWANRLSGNKI